MDESQPKRPSNWALGLGIASLASGGLGLLASRDGNESAGIILMCLMPALGLAGVVRGFFEVSSRRYAGARSIFGILISLVTLGAGIYLIKFILAIRGTYLGGSL